MGDTAILMKVDAEILNIRVLMRDKDDPAFKKQLEELLAKRAALLAEMERAALDRIK